MRQVLVALVVTCCLWSGQALHPGPGASLSLRSVPRVAPRCEPRKRGWLAAQASPDPEEGPARADEEPVTSFPRAVSRRGLVTGATAAAVWGLAPVRRAQAEEGENTIEEQLRQFRKDQLKEQAERLKMESKLTGGEGASLISRGVIVLADPNPEPSPLGFPDATMLDEQAFNNKNASVFISVFAKTGPPVAALRIPLIQESGVVQFPLAFEVRTTDLLYPLTEDAWAKDARNQGEMGVAVTVDSDGLIKTGNSTDLIGFGVSKPVPIGGVFEMTQPTITLKPRTTFTGYSEEQMSILERLDQQLYSRPRFLEPGALKK